MIGASTLQAVIDFLKQNAASGALQGVPYGKLSNAITPSNPYGSLPTTMAPDGGGVAPQSPQFGMPTAGAPQAPQGRGAQLPGGLQQQAVDIGKNFGWGGLPQVPASLQQSRATPAPQGAPGAAGGPPEASQPPMPPPRPPGLGIPQAPASVAMPDRSAGYMGVDPNNPFSQLVDPNKPQWGAFGPKNSDGESTVTGSNSPGSGLFGLLNSIFAPKGNDS